MDHNHPGSSPEGLSSFIRQATAKSYLKWVESQLARERRLQQPPIQTADHLTSLPSPHFEVEVRFLKQCTHDHTQASIGRQAWVNIATALGITGDSFEESRDISLQPLHLARLSPSYPAVPIRSRTRFAQATLSPTLPSSSDVALHRQRQDAPPPTTIYEQKTTVFYDKFNIPTTTWAIKYAASMETLVSSADIPPVMQPIFSRIKQRGTLLRETYLTLPTKLVRQINETTQVREATHLLLPEKTILPIRFRYDLSLVWEDVSVADATRKQSRWMDHFRHWAQLESILQQQRQTGDSNAITDVSQLNESLDAEMEDVSIVQYQLELEWENPEVLFQYWYQLGKFGAAQLPSADNTSNSITPGLSPIIKEIRKETEHQIVQQFVYKIRQLCQLL